MNNTEYNLVLDDVHSELADFYDEEYAKKPLFAMKTLSPIIRKLKERIDGLKKK